MEITGTSGNDTLTGSFDADVISGLEGNDTLDGSGGDDHVDGGSGDDFLGGGIGDDTVIGADGNDIFTAADTDGDDYEIGGAGDDTFLGTLGNDTLDGGTGADFFRVEYFSIFAVTATGGAGRDFYWLDAKHPSAGNSNYAVTDFAAGPGGDFIDIEPLLGLTGQVYFAPATPLPSGQLGYAGGNPFDPNLGFLRLQSSGGDTVLEWDRDGAAGTSYGWIAMLVLRGLNAADMTADNFAGGLSPAGENAPGLVLDGDTGSDTLSGWMFNDDISGAGGNDTLDGKAGDDLLEGGPGTDVLHGGWGSDTLLGGDGDDLFVIDFSAGSSRATGGTGIDTYQVEPTSSGRDYVVTDFAAGSGGDLVSVDALLSISAMPPSSTAEPPFTGGNPFDATLGFLRFLQSGPDTLLQWDRDGAAQNGFDWVTALTLENVEASSLTVDNMVAGIPPDGSPGVGLSLDGTNAGETLAGSFFNDTLSGLDGNDSLDGKGGDDLLLGGRGNDLLIGGLGNDSQVGGDGNDEFTWTDSFGDDTLIGGAGDDTFIDYYGDNVFDGGSGNDLFVLQGLSNEVAMVITGGEGRDLYALSVGFYFSPPLAMDFAVGPGGDLLDVETLLSSFTGFAGGNPFGAGYLRLIQSGADTLLQWDSDGPEFPSWQTAMALRGVTVSSITSDNFIGQLIVGTPNDDSLVGGLGNDTVQGLDGDDTLDGAVGKDILEGGHGNDIYHVDNVLDVVTETANTLVVSLAASESVAAPGYESALEGFIDTVIAAVDYSLSNVAYVENLTLSGDLAATQSGAFPTVATGNALDNALTGNALDNMLTGLGGNDTIDGAAGVDTALYSGNRASYTIGNGGGSVSGPEGSDTLANVERVQFADESLAFDLGTNQAAGNTVRIIGAAFDAENIVPEFVGIGLALFDAGYSMLEVCQLALGTPLWLSIAGSTGNEAFVNTVYENIVGSAPPPADRDLYVGLLAGSGGAMTQAQLLELAANAPVNELNIDLAGLQQTGVEFV